MSDFTTRRRAQLAAPGPTLDWLDATSCTAGGLSPHGRQLAFISDRDGLPALWLTDVPDDGDLSDIEARAVRLDTGPGHARAVSWSPDGAWLACQLAPFGGEHTRVVVLRPDGGAGSGLRELAGGSRRAAELGSWRIDSAGVGVTIAGPGSPDPTAYVIDPRTGERTRLVSGPAAQVCSFSRDARFAVVRVGRRGVRQLVVVHIATGRRSPILPVADAGVADARFSIDGARLYVHTDSGRERPALLELPWDRTGLRPETYARHTVLAARPDADLEHFAVCGTTVAVGWNVAGRSELELLDPDLEHEGTTGVRRQELPVPAEVVRSVSFAGDRSWLLVGSEGPTRPPHLSRYPLRYPDPTPHRVLPAAPGPGLDGLVAPTLLELEATDGTPLSGLWYPASGRSGPAPCVLWLHGGPEAQERPGFAPLLQALAATGIAVFAPNVRGSSGYGRRFVNADNHDRRWAAISDVAAVVDHLVDTGRADPHRVACAGRSYGGYLTLAALVAHPELFAAGVDVCGMSDLETFFQHTEPWIADAATSKYGDPGRDRALLRELSPLHRIDRMRAPLLVVHGEHDTNVPLIEARQVVDALRERGASPSLLLFPDEGHEIHGIDNRAVFVTSVVHWLSEHLLDAAEQTA